MGRLRLILWRFSHQAKRAGLIGTIGISTIMMVALVADRNHPKLGKVMEPVTEFHMMEQGWIHGIAINRFGHDIHRHSFLVNQSKFGFRMKASHWCNHFLWRQCKMVSLAVSQNLYVKRISSSSFCRSTGCKNYQFSCLGLPTISHRNLNILCQGPVWTGKRNGMNYAEIDSRTFRRHESSLRNSSLIHSRPRLFLASYPSLVREHEASPGYQQRDETQPDRGSPILALLSAVLFFIGVPSFWFFWDRGPVWVWMGGGFFFVIGGVGLFYGAVPLL